MANKINANDVNGDFIEHARGQRVYQTFDAISQQCHKRVESTRSTIKERW